MLKVKKQHDFENLEQSRKSKEPFLKKFAIKEAVPPKPLVDATKWTASLSPSLNETLLATLFNCFWRKLT